MEWLDGVFWRPDWLSQLCLFVDDDASSSCFPYCVFSSLFPLFLTCCFFLSLVYIDYSSLLVIVSGCADSKLLTLFLSAGLLRSQTLKKNNLGFHASRAAASSRYGRPFSFGRPKGISHRGWVKWKSLHPGLLQEVTWVFNPSQGILEC